MKRDKWGNPYPDRSKLYITTSKSGSSSGDLTLDYLEKVFFPEARAVNGNLVDESGLVLDAFTGHFDNKFKAVTEPNDKLSWIMMDGGITITPKAQPLDVLINKVWKGLYWDLFEEWSLCCPLNQKSGHPHPPSRQLIVQWVVMAWEKIPKELVQKAWVVSGDIMIQNLEDESASKELVQYSDQELGSIVENIS